METMICRICEAEKPIDQFILLKTNQRVNNNGKLMIYRYRDSRCNTCRRKLNNENMKRANAEMKRLQEHKPKRERKPKPRQPVTDNGFVFSSDINDWH